MHQYTAYTLNHEVHNAHAYKFTPCDFGNKNGCDHNITSPTDAESRSKTGTSDSDGLVSKSRGMKSAVWMGLRQTRKEDGPGCRDLLVE